MRLGLALGGHTFPFESLVDLARRAEALGFATLFVDGDASVVPSLGDADLLDGTTVTTALLERTERIEVTSIRLVHFWNAARLAQTLATQARIHPGRVRLFAAIGGHPLDRRFGLRFPPVGERVRWLDESLGAVRALLRGEGVTSKGDFVELDRAVVRPVPSPPVSVHVAGQGPRVLALVARHADAWDVNLPPLASALAPAEEQLARACARLGRDPAAIERSLWIFVRPGRTRGDPSLHEEFRRWNPWFAGLSDDELKDAVVAGSPGECIGQLTSISEELKLDLPVIDLSGMSPEAAWEALEALGSEKTLVDPRSYSP